MSTPPTNSILTSIIKANDHLDDKSKLPAAMEPNAFAIPPPVPSSSFVPRYHNASTTPISLADGSPGPSQPLNESANSRFHTGAGPRSVLFPESLPHGHTVSHSHSPLFPSWRGGVTHNDTSSLPLFQPQPDVRSASNPDYRYSGAALVRPRSPSNSLGTTDLPDDSVVLAASHTGTYASGGGTPTPMASIEQTTASQGNKQYISSDDLPVSGKGLGRGRPGVKRGPRGSIYDDQNSPKVVDSNTKAPAPPLPSNKKRKSVESDNAIINAQSSTSGSAGPVSRNSSEEYPTTTHTRSGRQTQKPVSLTNFGTVSASPSSKLSRADSSTNVNTTPTSNGKTHPKIKRRVYRGREQFALCEHCQRGHGPPGNVIVFCDACNKCWHQRCHDPQISKKTIADTKAQWFCSECDRILHGGKKGKKPQSKTTAQSIPTATIAANMPPVYAGPRVGGRHLHPDQQLAYLKTLSSERLISLLLQAADLAPDLPIFETLVPAPQTINVPQAQFTSTYVTPVSKPPAFLHTAPDDAVDEGYDGYYDEHAALYPKPGQGVQLPPDREDLYMLLEGKDSRTFSHWIRGKEGNEFSGTGNVVD